MEYDSFETESGREQITIELNESEKMKLATDGFVAHETDDNGIVRIQLESYEQPEVESQTV
ncbi:hypothetical protein [His2 virus]|uniref:Uncharacterized protein n=1 Tax=His 2 virus TaxID=128710 RepID=Q25BD8_HIS2V|nr:hypothetical protein His2V_gp22 [His2 virus]AAQ13789.1 hypothetical protein [His2 virus]